MKVTLIKPNMGLVGGRPYDDHGRMEPLTLAVLAGMLPDEVECVIRDDRLSPAPVDEPTDLVAINVEVYTAWRVYEIAAAYRRRGVPVVLGGTHVSMLPDEAAQYADSIVLGDAEGVWPQVVADAGAGRLQPRYQGSTTAALRNVRARRDLYAGKGYLPLCLTHFSRGCVHACEYCATAAVYGGTHRCRPPEEVVEELRAQPSRVVFFVDDNITASPDAAKELFRRMIPLRRRWVSQASLDFVHDAELVDLMRRSGCTGLVVGFESLDPDSLRQMRKTPNLAFRRYEDALDVTRRMGLMLWAAFVLGYDGDTVESIAATANWAVQQRFCFAAYNTLTPYPSTPLYARLQDEGRLLYDRWWLDPGYRFGDAAFRPARMTADELTDACFLARRRFNGPASVLTRAWDFCTNAKDLWSLAVYFAYNPLFRREVFQKHGMRLGYGDVPPAPWQEDAPCRA